MARPRTPTNVLMMKGTFKQNPHYKKKREGEPTVEGAFPKTPPKWLTQEEQAVWYEVVRAAPSGVLTSADAILVEILSRLLSEFRQDGAHWPTNKITQLRALLRSIGMDPSGRASLSVPQVKDNPFEGL